MKKEKIFFYVLSTIFTILSYPAIAFADSGEAAGDLGSRLPMWTVLPFVGMLLSIAVIPLVKQVWWEHNQMNVASFWSLCFLVPFGFYWGKDLLITHLLEILLLDYLPFIILLFGLFVVTGGIVLRGDLKGTPAVNSVLLLIGTILASWIGTTGASMLLIRPVIRANQGRKKKAHVVIFFIFLVSNIGGCLTPVGDPPLFLGFLRGIPFFWTMRLLPMMIINTVILLAVLFALDTMFYRQELRGGKGQKKKHGKAGQGARGKHTPLKLEGLHNLIYLAMIVGAIILSGLLPVYGAFADQITGQLKGIPLYGGGVLAYSNLIQMIIILLAALLSWKTTKKSIRSANAFTWDSIREVGILFLGIFITMIPALALLQTNGAALGISTPAGFFWGTGILSSFLDNAPTYLVFLSTAGGLGFTEGLQTTMGLIPPEILKAISAGAVFMGANTYIGNAPNFMVRSIAEENKIKMPSFFGYMGWSICILIPLFFLNTLLFF